MSSLTFTMPLHLHGITPVRPDENYRFVNLTAPGEFFLKERHPHVRYTLSSDFSKAPWKALLILVVDDQDPVGHESQLKNWNYVDTYELSWHTYHVWWHLAPKLAL